MNLSLREETNILISEVSIYDKITMDKFGKVLIQVLKITGIIIEEKSNNEDSISFWRIVNSY